MGEWKYVRQGLSGYEISDTGSPLERKWVSEAAPDSLEVSSFQFGPTEYTLNHSIGSGWEIGPSLYSGSGYGGPRWSEKDLRWQVPGSFFVDWLWPLLLVLWLPALDSSSFEWQWSLAALGFATLFYILLVRAHVRERFQRFIGKPRFQSPIDYSAARWWGCGIGFGVAFGLVALAEAAGLDWIMAFHLLTAVLIPLGAAVAVRMFLIAWRPRFLRR